MLGSTLLRRLPDLRPRIHTDHTSRDLQVESLELRTNVVAAYVAGGRSSEAGAVMEAMHSSAPDGYELAFNRACALVEQGDYPAAEEQLQLALRTGAMKGHEEDLSCVRVWADCLCIRQHVTACLWLQWHQAIKAALVTR